MTTQSDFNRETAQQFAQLAKKAGFRVFLAERGTYGFFTGSDGHRVVSFQCDGLSCSISGSYRPVNPQDGRSVGRGWQIADSLPDTVDGVRAAYMANPPLWATNGLPVRLADLETYLGDYQKSSRFTEV